MGEERELARRRIIAVATALAGVREHLVFIGGTVLPLLVDVDDRFYAPRMTDDVDAVGVAVGYAQSAAVEAAVLAAMFKPNLKSKHKGSWVGPQGDIFDLSFAGDFPGASGARVDVLAIETAQPMEGHPEVRHLSPTGLFLMKCAAFRDRGRENPFESKDLADLAVLLVAGRLEQDVAMRSDQVRAEVQAMARGLMQEPRLLSALLSHFADRRPVPPDTEEDLAAEAMSVLQSLFT